MTACSLTTSFDGLTGSSAGPAPSDARAEDDGGDFVLDAAPLDADAASDASLSCDSVAPTPALCDEFSQGLSAGVWQTTIVGQATIGVDDKGFVSPPSSLIATVAQSAAGAGAAAHVFAATSRLKVTARVRLEAGDVTEPDVVLSVSWRPPIGRLDVEVLVTGTGDVQLREVDTYEDGGKTTFESGRVVVGVGRWVDLTLDAGNVASTGSADLIVDGAPLHLSLAAAVPVAPVTLTIGARVETAAATAARVRFDDVVVW